MIKRPPQAFDGHGMRVLCVVAVRVAIWVAVCVVAVGGASAQTAESLAQVKKIYIGSLSAHSSENGRGAEAMRARIAERLRASRKIQVVANAAEADAVLEGTGRIWATGYFSLGVHPSRANSQPELDGYLSAEVQGKSGVILWSYLVTPSRFSVKKITSDLADELVRKLLEAVEQAPKESQAATPRENAPLVAIHGAGATFPWPIYQKWFESYELKAPNSRISYDPIGSESGIQLLEKGSVDFAGSDMPLSDQAMSQPQARFLHFATVLGAVVPIYNLSGVRQTLNFTPEALAGIYLGTVKRWNDATMQAANRGVSLPDSEIVVVHRSDGSGTTFAWTDYLSKVSAQWKERAGAAGTTISWPVGEGAERNEGVAARVRETPNSIGYVELIYAIQHELRYGAVRNAAGNFIKADLASVTAAATGIPENKNADFRISITNPAARDAYPIASFTWLLLPAENDGSGNDKKREAVIEFLKWALTAGQKQCSGLGYAPLPAAVADQEMGALNGLR